MMKKMKMSLFDEWNDVEAVLQFMVQHKAFLKNKIWSRVVEPEDAARQVLNEAEYLENRFDELNENTIKGKIPDFDSHFKYLDGPVYYSEWKQWSVYLRICLYLLFL